MRRSGGERPPFANGRPMHIRRGNTAPGNDYPGVNQPLLFATENLNPGGKAGRVHVNGHAQSSPAHENRTPPAHSGWTARKAADSTEDLLQPSGSGFETILPTGETSSKNSARSADGGFDSTVQTLRCMFTSQKTKKRKVWSDGAVKCCSKRQRVSLYRWSDVLGVTDKLLGEVYLSVPEYKAFVNNGEPELEMELYIVSLDGVIQEAPLTAEGSIGSTTDTAGAGSAAHGRKRKLLKPFKPPSRTAPPAAPPLDSWGARRNGNRLVDGGNVPNGERDSQGEARNGLKSRSCYTGFGHVASLWEDDDDDEIAEGSAGLSAASGGSGSGWGLHNEGSGRGPQDRHDPGYKGLISDNSSRGGGTGFAGSIPDGAARMVQLSAAATTIPTACNGRVVDTWRRHDDLRAPDNSYSSHDSAEHSVRQNSARYRGASDDGCAESVSDGHVHDRQSIQGHEPYTERNPGEHKQATGGRYVDETGIDREGRNGKSHRGQSYYEEEEDGVGVAQADHGTLHQHGDFSAHAVGYSMEKHQAIEGRSSEHGSHEGRDGCEEGHTRSTQDILSLFGGLGNSPLDEPSVSAPDSARDLSSAAPSESSLMAPGDPRSQAPGQEHPPPGIGNEAVLRGRGTAADMRRAQRAAREAQQQDRIVAVVDAAESTPATTHSANSAPAVGPWDCAVCGVHGTPSALSCRVCGAQRPREIGNCRGVSSAEEDGNGSDSRYDASAASCKSGESAQQQNEQESDGGVKFGDSWTQNPFQHSGEGQHVFPDDAEQQYEHDDGELEKRAPVGELRMPVQAGGLAWHGLREVSPANDSGRDKGCDAAGRPSHHNAATPGGWPRDSSTTRKDQRQGTMLFTATASICRMEADAGGVLQRRPGGGMSVDVGSLSDSDNDV